MNDTAAEQKTDLIVIGAGLAGSIATAFAAARGIKTIQVGATLGQTLFASGVLDLLGIHPPFVHSRWEDPWAGIASLINDQPEHPYAKAGIENIRRAWQTFFEMLQGAGLPYCGWGERNATLATCAGTLKTTYQVPQTMWPGVLGLENKQPALIIDFEGMKEFSGVQIVETLGDRWPGLRTHRLEFPSTFIGTDRQNIFMAEALEYPQIRTQLADAIAPLLEDVQLVGLPAILGLQQHGTVIQDLEQKLGVSMFEIPTMPPSVPGLRLKEALEKEALRGGAVTMHGMRVATVQSDGRRGIRVSVKADHGEISIEARGMILATGRFLGGGLTASRGGIRETLLDLPVHQPKHREDWHHASFLDPHGHPINRAGLEIDRSFRPLGQDGQIAYDKIFAAGSVLAHQDWVRTKCGAGLAIATAFAAVQSFVELG